MFLPVAAWGWLSTHAGLISWATTDMDGAAPGGQQPQCAQAEKALASLLRNKCFQTILLHCQEKRIYFCTGCSQMVPLLILELKLKSLCEAEGNEASQCPERGAGEIPHPHPLSLLAASPSPRTCFTQQNEKAPVGKAGGCMHIWLYCFVIISREIENVIMIIKLNRNLPIGATELFISTFHPNSLNCSLPRGGGALAQAACVVCWHRRSSPALAETAASGSSCSA